MRTKRIKSYLIEQNELKISILISGNNYRKLRSVFRLIAEIYKFSLQLHINGAMVKMITEEMCCKRTLQSLGK